jgi:hypothetical protein
VRVAGVIAEAHNLPNRAWSAGFLRDIGSGKAYSMFLETPPSGTSYHLYAAGVEGACAAVLGQIIYSDVVVLSKFGKLEAAGGGLAPAFTAPIAAGKPVLTTVSDLHQAACYGLAPDALRLPAGAAAIRDWWAEIGVSCRVARPSLCARFRSAASRGASANCRRTPFCARITGLLSEAPSSDIRDVLERPSGLFGFGMGTGTARLDVILADGAAE